MANFTFSDKSIEKLNTCDQQLQRLFKEVVKHIDCTILCGHRTQEEQEEAFNTGKSKLHWPQGKHCSIPSKAVDVAITPIDWSNSKAFYLFAGYVLATAQNMDIKVRWGGCWSGELNKTVENKFADLVHFELVEDSSSNQ
jgi:peptidoglycan L-alanyl-D-glutamate endopeptidase CwlK